MLYWSKLTNYSQLEASLKWTFQSVIIVNWISLTFGWNNQSANIILSPNKTNLHLRHIEWTEEKKKNAVSVWLPQQDPCGVSITKWCLHFHPSLPPSPLILSSFTPCVFTVLLLPGHLPVSPPVPRTVQGPFSTWGISDTLVFQLLRHEITSVPPLGS